MSQALKPMPSPEPRGVLHFHKMQGLGNDFVIIDALDEPVSLCADQWRQIADRRLGVGCDQIMLVEPATEHGSQFAYRIFNADGSSAQQCGNGVRCVTKYLIDHRHVEPRLHLQSPAGPVVAELVESSDYKDWVRVDMGVPLLNPDRVPFEAAERANSYALSLGDVGVEIGAVSIGNPHAILRVEDVNKAPIGKLGPAIGSHPRFPEQANVGFLETVDARRVKLRVFERGAGETQACGSGACAAVVAGRLWGVLDERVTVRLLGGELLVEWPGEGRSVWMTGPAEYVFEGQLELQKQQQ